MEKRDGEEGAISSGWSDGEGEGLGAYLDRVFGVLDDVGPEAKDAM